MYHNFLKLNDSKSIISKPFLAYWCDLKIISNNYYFTFNKKKIELYNIYFLDDLINHNTLYEVKG